MTDLTYDRAGPTDTGRPAVVLVHAGVADRRMWQPQWPALTSAYDTMRPDLRGFGDSDSPPADGRLDPVADLLGLLDELDIDSAHLVGASFGAGVCVDLALTEPDRVASLSLLAPGGSLLAEATPDFRAFAAAESAALEDGDLDTAVQANLDAWVVGPRRTAEAVDDRVLALVRSMQRRAFDIDRDFGDLETVELEPPTVERLDELTAPMLVLSGAEDLETVRETAGRLGALDCCERAIQWPDVAHLPSLERPEQTTALLTDWLESR